jgi:hypothetical protein
VNATADIFVSIDVFADAIVGFVDTDHEKFCDFKPAGVFCTYV